MTSMTSTATLHRPVLTSMTEHEVRLTERFHTLLDADHDPITAAVTVWRNADLAQPFTAAFMEHLTGGALTVDPQTRIQRGPRWSDPGSVGRPLPTARKAVAVIVDLAERNVVDLAERYGMPTPIGSFADCDCASDLALSGTCCERGRRRQGIPVPPMPYGAEMYVPHNRD